MTNNISPRLEEWQDQTKNLVEQDGIRVLCLYLDQKSGKVNLIADSESQKRLIQSRVALTELENILESEVDEKDKLRLYNHNQLREGEKSCSKSGHICHNPVPMFQLAWEKNLPSSCFVGKKWFPDVKDYDKLPAEILRIIFGFLEPEDLKDVLLVSKNWKSVADEPILWAGFDLPRKCRRNVQKFYRFLDFSLSSKLQHLTLTGDEPPNDINEYDDHFKFEIKDKHIKHLMNLELASVEIKNIDLSKVSDEVLGQFINKCKECDITEYYEDEPPNNNLNLSSDDDDEEKLFLGVKKITSIFKAIQETLEVSRLKSLRLKYARRQEYKERMNLDLSAIPSDILVAAFSRLEILDLEDVFLNSEQLSSIFDLGFGRSLRRLRLHGVEMDFIQARHFIKVLDTNCQLKKLELSEVDVSDIPSMFFAGVINKIEWVVFKDMEVDSDQLEEIFLAIIRGDSAMKHLGMFGENLNSSLSFVTEEVFAKAVNKLESVSFDEKLSQELIEEMFNVMSIETNLKILGMPDSQVPVGSFENIGCVNPEILAKALHNLKSVRIDFGDCSDCFFTMPQLIAFFKQLDSTSQLKKIVREDWPDFKCK